MLIELTVNEFKLLKYLLEHHDSICSRDQILNDVWGDSVYLYPRIIDTYICRLRKKLKDSSVTIKSKSRRGYHIQSK
jgi:DNA-binding response OmpR family regulator